MFVMDALYCIIPKDLKLAVTAGITTGDENPNNEPIDSRYSGFIPLQEAYFGQRVRSSFLLGGAGKLKRPLSIPVSRQAPSRFAQTVNGFTNLVFVGSGLNWKPSNLTKTFCVNPNIYVYWQENPSKKFDAATKKQLDYNASTYLGTEFNLFFDYTLMKDLTLQMVSALFVPGTHYKDVKGLPLDAAQRALLDKLDATGFDDDRVPNLGNNLAYTFNASLTFKF